MKIRLFYILCISLSLTLSSCESQWNNPYSSKDHKKAILYSAFAEQPKHLDPAMAYSSDEYQLITQIYEPPFQYHYLKRPYQLIPLTATKMPTVNYLNAAGQILALNQEKEIAFTEYLLDIQPKVYYQPHPAFAQDAQQHFLYHHLTPAEINSITTLADFAKTGKRELIAEDYVSQIKRLANPKNQSPIAEIMKQYIVGFAEFAQQLTQKPQTSLSQLSIAGVTAVDRYRYRIKIKGIYPQFKYWLAMPFFSPIPWEAEAFYAQPGLIAKNINLDNFPVGTGAYFLAENNANRRMVLRKNPYFHSETYPSEGDSGDKEHGYLADAGKKLPFIEEEIYSLEKESIPYWNKFLQGYYDVSGIASDSFDQAIQLSGSGTTQLTNMMLEKNIYLETAISPSIFYLGFNMLDNVVGGNSEAARKLRLAISIAIDYEEYASIFLNDRAIVAQGILPPGIYGYATDKTAFNPYVYFAKGQRQSLKVAQQLLIEAGYPNGIDPKTKEALTLYFDTVNVDDRAKMNWYRKQLEKLKLKLVIRATDHNRFQEKLRTGNAQLFFAGWNADYPDSENFFFLLYGGNGKVKYGGENIANYHNPQFDRLFEQMRHMEDTPQRYQIIQQMQDLIRHDAPWVFALHPKQFVLSHSWYHNIKADSMINNKLKYERIDADLREKQRTLWNQPHLWPLLLTVLLLAVLFMPAIYAYRHRLSMPLKPFRKSGEK